MLRRSPKSTRLHARPQGRLSSAPFASTVVRRSVSSGPPRPAPEYNRFPSQSGSRQREPFPPILTPFQKNVLRLPPGSQPRWGGGQQPSGQPGGGGPHGGGTGGGGPRRGGGFQGFWNALYGKQKLAVVGLTGGAGYYVYHLEKVPETGRLRFMDLSPESEKQVALKTFNETLREYKPLLLPASHPTARYVERVAKRIVEGGGLGHMKGSRKPSSGGGWGGGLFGETGLGGGGEDWGQTDPAMKARAGEDVEWEVFVIDDKKTKNAFVLPGGKIFVFTGILPVCANEDGLASVMGHEVAHQVARHSAERMSSLKVLTVLGFALEAVGLDIGISRLLLTFLLSLPNSRKAESEADFIGLRLMSKACFDPRESPKMWQRMSASETSNSSQFPGAANLDFLSTHPANSKRIKAIESWLPEALSLRAASPCGDTSSRFEALRDPQETPLPSTSRGRGGGGQLEPAPLGGERMGRW